MGRYTFIGIRPYKKMTAREGQITVIEGRKRRTYDADIFSERRPRSKVRPWRSCSFCCRSNTAGAVGFFAYDVVRRIEQLPELAADELHVPDAYLMFFDEVLAFDHVKKAIHLIVTAGARSKLNTAAYADANKRLDRLERMLNAAIVKPQARSCERPV